MSSYRSQEERSMEKRNLTALARLIDEAAKRGYSRRQFIARATALGISTSMFGVALGAFDRRAAAQAAEPAGKITISLAAEPSTLENWNAYSLDGHPVIRNIQEALLNRDPATNEIVGELATAWEQVDDKTIRFTLRQGVTYHNGDPFNAEAAAFGVNYTWSKENAFDIIQFMGPQISATAVDEFTLDVSTETPDPILPARLYFAPLPNMKQVQENPDSLPNEAIGTGPYKLVEWKRGEHILLTAYENWWGKTASDARGTQSIKDVEYVFRAESSVRAAQVNAGEVQIGRFLAPEDCASVPTCKESPSVETVFLRLDTMHPAMADIKVREAIGLAVDKERLVKEIFGGGEVASQLVGPSATGYNPDLKPLPYDVDRATQLVADAKAAGTPVDMEITVAVRQGAYPTQRGAWGIRRQPAQHDRPEGQERGHRARGIPGTVRDAVRRGAERPWLDRHALAWQRNDGRRSDRRRLLPVQRGRVDLLRSRDRQDDRRGRPADR
jgi:peptide/nickel transport system substrate-binding protein